MTELYFSILEVKHLLNFTLRFSTAKQGVMLQISADEHGPYLTADYPQAPRCNTVKIQGEELQEEQGWAEEFPIDQRFFSLIQEADNWGHLVLALSEDEMNVFLEESGMTGCLN